MRADLAARVRAWIADDPDPVTRHELEGLLEADAEAELADRFAGRLEFGTAGLRGILGGGPNRMNRAVVIAATAGLCDHLVASRLGDRGIVIGYDGRRLSRELAEEAARTAAGRGVKAHLFPELGPTPLLAYAVTVLGTGAGAMVTASHNPPEYNGFKVYWQNGAQIVPPTDTAIAAAIERVGSLSRVPRPALPAARASGLVLDVPRSIRAGYLSGIAGQIPAVGPGRDALGIVYTAMHGVGGALAREALAHAGFQRVHVVAAQQEPDGAFPTVAFPNPEEPGALDLALALAEEKRADVVIANDPDADRLAVAARGPDGRFAPLSGNQVGALLGAHVLEGQPRPERCLAITTIVSSPFLGALCAKLGVRYEETLTGFKWIANRALELAPEGLEFRFGYEEALGYTVGTLVRDKDGIGAGLVLADLAARCKAQRRTLWERLDELYRAYGYFESGAKNVTHKGQDGAARIAATMQALRASPPARVGDLEVKLVTDVGSGHRRGPGGPVEAIALPRSNVIAFALADGSRVTVRPSGTEPKIKFYFDVREEVRRGEPMAGAKARARQRLAALEAAFLALIQP